MVKKIEFLLIDYFLLKHFKMNIKKNDFIELNLRMFLEYENLDDAAYS